MKELTETLKLGVTPVVSHFSPSKISWLVGVGKDKKGPCDASMVKVVKKIKRSGRRRRRRRRRKNRRKTRIDCKGLVEDSKIEEECRIVLVFGF